MAEVRSSLGRYQPAPIDPEAAKRRGWRAHGNLDLPRFGGRVTAWVSSSGLDPPFILHGREVAEGGMPAARVIPALDEAEDGHPGLGLGAEAAAVEQLALERGEEALAQRIIS